jgi:hypothetical protein
VGHLGVKHLFQPFQPFQPFNRWRSVQTVLPNVNDKASVRFRIHRKGNLETSLLLQFFRESFVDQILGFQRANLFAGRAEEPNRRTNAVDVRKAPDNYWGRPLAGRSRGTDASPSYNSLYKSLYSNREQLFSRTPLDWLKLI